jgi:hypothetical protein
VSKGNGRPLLSALLKGLWIYSLIVWLFVVASFFIFPQYQYDQISIYIPIPQDVIADISLPISFVSFIVWEYLRKRESSRML